MSRIASSRPVKLGSSLPRHDRAMAGQGLGLMVALALAVLPGALAAQTQSAPVQTLPGLDSYSLPSGRPTPVPEPAPTIGPMVRPTPTPPPAPTPVPPPAAPTPTARPAGRPALAPTRNAPAPRPTPTATPAPTRRTAPAPVPTPSATPTAAPPVLAPAPLPVPSAAAPVPPAPAPAQVSSGGSSTGWWIGGAVLLLAALAGAGMLLCRRRADEDHVEEQPLAEPPVEEAPVAEPVAPAAPAPSMLRSRNRSAPEPAAVPQPRPRIAIAFTARRAGTNLTSAAVDYEVTLTNSGDLGARAVTLAILILTAYAGQDRELDGFFAAPIDRPPAPPFDLAPGESVSLAGMGLLPLDRVNALTVQGVAMFVPVMAVNVLYGWGEIGTGQDAEAFLIGLDRGGETKLAPFRLDQGPRMFTEVAVRPHGEGRRR